MPILPLPTIDDPDGLDPLVVKKLKTMPSLNVLWMLGRTGWLDDISALLSQMFDSAQFPPRDREAMILRIAAQLHVDYPIPQHRMFAKNVGMEDATIEAIIRRDFESLDEWTVQLCRICEEITENVTLSPESLETLVEHYGKNDTAKAVWLMGWFNMLVRFVGSTRIPIEDDFNESTSTTTGPV
jgi:hypothetical protein